jgi:hypothetical protein
LIIEQLMNIENFNIDTTSPIFQSSLNKSKYEKLAVQLFPNASYRDHHLYDAVFGDCLIEIKRNQQTFSQINSGEGGFFGDIKKFNKIPKNLYLCQIFTDANHILQWCGIVLMQDVRDFLVELSRTDEHTRAWGWTDHNLSHCEQYPNQQTKAWANVVPLFYGSSSSTSARVLYTRETVKFDPSKRKPKRKRKFVDYKDKILW